MSPTERPVTRITASQRPEAIATPSTSVHVSGDAVDLGGDGATRWMSAHGAGYGLSPYFRISTAASDEVLVEATARIARAVAALKDPAAQAHAQPAALEAVP